MDRVLDGPFGVVGGGVIGSGWATRALARGYDVVAFDPAPDAKARMLAAIDRAWSSVRRMGLHTGADPTRITFVGSAEAVASRSSFVQESVPEIVDLKRDVLATLDGTAGPDTIIASSTSGIRPTELQAGMERPARLVVGHPFNPVYLLPLVEVVGGEATTSAALAQAEAVYEDLDMYPLRVRNEIDGFLSDRLQEAMWREILHLVADGVATTGELDDAIVYGPGLRWAIMGTNLNFHLAGGDGGMRSMLEHFGPALEWPWTKLAAPPLTDELIDRMVTGTEAQSEGRTVAQLERLRDDALVAIMYALRESQLGAGQIVSRRGARSAGGRTPPRWAPGADVPMPLPVYHCGVEPDWVDAAGRMTGEAAARAFARASDALLRYVGIDEEYRAAGYHFRAAESHLVFHQAPPAGALLSFTTQLLGHDRQRLHIFHSMHDGDSGERLGSNEQLLMHAEAATGRSHPILEGPQRALDQIWQAHGKAPRPERTVMTTTR